jgi:hypothetical protein
MGRPRKTTSPQGVNRRLEEVRKAAGFDSLHAFWQRLTSGDYHVSYEALRNYHFNRQPTLEYLAQVARAFGYRLEWLVYGEEPKLTADWVETIRSGGRAPGGVDLEALLDERFPYYAGLRPDARAAVGLTMLRLSRALRWRFPDITDEHHQRRRDELIDEVGSFVRRVVRMLYNPTTGPATDRLDDFVIGVAIAVRSLIPPARDRGGEQPYTLEEYDDLRAAGDSRIPPPEAVQALEKPVVKRQRRKKTDGNEERRAPREE